MTSLDIIELIEKNPITKLSQTYNNKLLIKIKQNFNEQEQQMFITSFYCYLNYHVINDFVIDLDNIWKWLGFSQKVKAKSLLEKSFFIDIDYKLFVNDISLTKETRGGHNKETIMLNIKTFKRFCIKADTKKANEIHEYFIKLEETLHDIIEEESDEMKNQLQQKTNEIISLEESNKKEYEQKLKIQKELDRQQLLLREFGDNCSIVYIIKVKSFENGEYIIKIGESRRGVKGRYNEHRKNYGSNTLLLDCFIVNRSKDFENFLHCHKDININKVKNLEGHERENELFLIGNKLTYQMVLNIIDLNIRNFNDYNFNETQHLKLEVEKIYLELEKVKMIKNIESPGLTNHFLETPTDYSGTKNTPINLIVELLNQNKKILEKLELLENHIKSIEILEKSNQSQIKTTTNFGESLVTLGPRLQKINPETIQLVRVYESVAECMKEDYKLKRPSINKAIQENTVYQGFRWLFVDRELDPNIIHSELEKTKQTRIQNLDYIAKVNEEKTEILNIYLDRKTAALQNGYSISGLDIAVQKQSLTKNHYYITYNKCDDILKQNFEEKYGKPILYKNGIGQYDLHNKLVKEFICKYDCIRILKISDKTLVKALDNDIPYNNHYFRKLPSKVWCL